MNTLIQRILQTLFVLGFVGIVVAGILASYPKYRHAQDLRAERDRILQRIEEKQREIAELRNQQRRFNTDREFVETLARRNRRVFPGELVFIFDN